MAAKMRSEKGKEDPVKNGERFDNMRSGPSDLWARVEVAFVDPPVRGMSYVADAERWTIVHNGVTYEATRPYVCNNLLTRVVIETSNCDLIVVPIFRTGEQKVGTPIWGPAEDAECHGWQKVDVKDGKVVRLLGERGELAPGCIGPAEFCDYSRSDRIVQLQRTANAKVEGLTPGHYGFWVPRKSSQSEHFRMGFCVLYTNPSTGEWYTSNVPVVRNIDYTSTFNGHRVAIIAYNQKQLPPGVRVNDPGGLYLWSD